jgi:ribonuclease HI
MPTLPRNTVVAYVDGGSRGNPGPAGFGVRVETAQGTPIEELCEAVGVATNNVAEYRGLLAALTWGLEHGYRCLRVRSDSELLVRQMRGEYRVKNRGLQALYRQACTLVDRFERVSFEHVPRSQNQNADRLANLAMDQADRPSGVRRPASAVGASTAAPVRSARGKRVDPRTRESGVNEQSTTSDSGLRTPDDVSRRDGLPFEDRLPDNSRQSADSPRNTRRPRRT